jgi:iron complex transport system substrate-binding protein
MIRKSLVAFLTLLIVLTACAPAQTSTPTPVPTSTEPPATAVPTTAPITLTDGLGRSVTLAGPARKVISLAPSNTEILFAIGAGSQVMGRDLFSDYPEAAKAVQDIGGSMGQYNTEAIVALQPDLILAGGINTPELVASLEKVGLTVYFLPNPETLEQMYANLVTVGQLTGRETDAAALVDSLKARVAAVDAKIAPLSNTPTVYYELDATNPAMPYTYGPGSFGDLLIKRAGGINTGAQLQGQWAAISLEQLVAANPSIVILGDAAYGETPEKFAARAGLQGLEAVKNNRIYTFDDNLLSRPGPRLVDGLEALAKILHPELFK